MRILTFLEYCAILAGAVGMLAGHIYALPNGVHLGLFLIGAGIALGGLESISTRQISFRFSSDAGEAYAGMPAVIWGLMALLVGGVVIASAYLLQAGSWHTAVNYLNRRPGPAVAVAGLLSTGIGTLLTLNPRGRRGVWWTLLVRIPKMIVGLALIAAGLAGIGLGVWEWLEPRAFTHFLRTLPVQGELRALDRIWGEILRLLR